MKMLSTQNWTRRRLLQATALSTGIAPFMPIHALPAPPRKRVIFVYTPLGARRDQWEPSGCGAAIRLGVASAPLAPIKHHCLFLNNLYVHNGGQGLSQKVLGGAFLDNRRKTTLDILLGEALSENVQIPNLFLGTHILSGNAVVSMKDFNAAPYYRSSATAYQELFNTDSAEATPVDNKFRAELAATPDTTNFDKEVDLQIELSALALSRNLTNAVTLMWGDTDGEFLLPNSFPEFEGMSYHQAVHTSPRHYAIFRAYLSAKFTYLVQLLEVMRDENNQSLLDSTLVVHVTDQGDGDTHSSEHGPYFMAGGKTLFRNGVVLDAARATQMDLMDTIAAAYGLQDVKFGEKTIEGLTLA